MVSIAIASVALVDGNRLSKQLTYKLASPVYKAISFLKNSLTKSATEALKTAALFTVGQHNNLYFNL